MEITLNSASRHLQYFSKFGDVVQVLLADHKKGPTELKWGFVIFSDRTGSAKALQEANHQLQSKQIFVQACDSCNQPKPQQIDEDHTTNKLLQLNDDCLTHIFKLLSRQDQLQLARVCPRLRNVFQMACKLEYKVLNCNIIAVCSYGRHEFLELVGPITETIVVQTFHCKRALTLIANLCPNVKIVRSTSMKRNVPYLQEFLKKLKYLTKLELKYCYVKDDDILAITNLTNLESLTISKKYNFKGKHLNKLVNVKTLNLRGCYEIEPTYFINMCKSLKELKLLDIRDCRLLGKTAINEMATHCHKLEILKMSYAEACVVHLPELNNLHIIDCWEQPFLVALAEHAQQLEYLRIDYGNRAADDIGVLIARLKKLKQLIWGCKWVEPATHKISNCVSNLSNLKSVEIRDYTSLGHQLFVALAEHAQQLEHLIIYSTNWITYDIVVLIAGLKSLKRLVCHRNEALDDISLRKLAELKALEEIDVSHCRSFTNEGLMFLISKCTKLKNVNIECCEQITDAFVGEAVEVLRLRQEQSKEQLLLQVLDTGIHMNSETSQLKLPFTDSEDDEVNMDSGDSNKALNVSEHYPHSDLLKYVCVIRGIGSIW